MASVLTEVSNKRRRSSNFTTEEKMCLVDLVTEFRHVIENKRTDAVSSREKDAAWIEISTMFKVITAKERSAQALKSCWDNIKKRCRKAVADDKVKLMKTGGGSAIINSDPLIQRVRDLISSSLDGMYNPYDCDADDVAIDHLKDLTGNSPQVTEQVVPEVSGQSWRRRRRPPTGDNGLNIQERLAEKLALTILDREQAHKESELKQKLLKIQLENENTALENAKVMLEINLIS